jgi:hypothetical protein
MLILYSIYKYDKYNSCLHLPFYYWTVDALIKRFCYKIKYARNKKVLIMNKQNSTTFTESFQL